MKLSDSLRYLSGVGPVNARKLAKLNLLTVEDLIYHFPFRYSDFSSISTISQASVGEVVTLQGEVWSIKNIYTRNRRVLTKAILNDGTGSLEITWFNQPYLAKTIQSGERIQVSGKVAKYGSQLSVVAPVWEKITEGKVTLHTGKLVPVYPETAGLSSKFLRLKIAQVLPHALPQIEDPLPLEVKDGMMNLALAIKTIHLPRDLEQAVEAKERLSFDELFLIQLSTQKKRLDWSKKVTVQPLKIDYQKLESFLRSLPFKLTSSQEKVLHEVVEDLKKDIPMNRLIQGEVGSGKTVVATVAIYLTYLAGMKSFLMAPTEILAFQHFDTISNLLSPYGIKVGIYTGSRKQAQGSHIVVGTHALLSGRLSADNIGLIIVDEQQRFGVEQRSLLRSRSKLPNFLSLTATPIPRTVALTLYGDLDISVILKLPKGRKKVKTFVVPNRKRADAYTFIAKKVKEGGQAYIITPLIESSETAQTARAAKLEFERLKKEIFPDFKLGLLHGKLKSKEKEQSINDFKRKKIDILVSTSVVEVGVDIPNATVMVIEGADRFGLAQLHQLRGRVGRREKQSFCLLFTEIEESYVLRRLKNLEKIYNGLELSELDLKIRGSGDIYGIRQSGRWELRVASLTDLELIQRTKEEAQKLLRSDPTLDKYPNLKRKLSGISDLIMPD